MKWLEIIELRSVDSNRELLKRQLKALIDEAHKKAEQQAIKVYNKRQLKALIDEAHKKAEQQAIKVYNHVAIDTDFSIHLLYNSVKADINGSPLGLQLVSTLKKFGLVNHSVWIEKLSK
jgi:alkyl hydroperoxide reductase subunit AhpF